MSRYKDLKNRLKVCAAWDSDQAEAIEALNALEAEIDDLEARIDTFKIILKDAMR